MSYPDEWDCRDDQTCLIYLHIISLVGQGMHHWMRWAELVLCCSCDGLHMWVRAAVLCAVCWCWC